MLGLGADFRRAGIQGRRRAFQIYGPDVYEGAPTPVTALLASGPKAATFAIMLRIFMVAFGASANIWFWAIAISAVLTMFIGNLAAIVQTNVKRMLAYSSIAHAGYILVAFAASTAVGVAAVLFYLGAYVLMKVGAFLVVTHLGQQGEKRLEIRDYAGLGSKQPVLAACFSLFLFSLLGLPATGGFLGNSCLSGGARSARPALRLAGGDRRHQQRHRRVLLPARDHRDVLLGAVERLHAHVRGARARPRAGHRRHRHGLSRRPPGRVLALAKSAADSLSLH